MVKINTAAGISKNSPTFPNTKDRSKITTWKRGKNQAAIWIKPGKLSMEKNIPEKRNMGVITRAKKYFEFHVLSCKFKQR